MGVKNAMPVDHASFDFVCATLKRLVPDAEWCVAEGGHARTGLEDNLRLDRDTLAPSNAALVRRVVDLCACHGRPVVTPAQARGILGLPEMAVA